MGPERKAPENEIGVDWIADGFRASMGPERKAPENLLFLFLVTRN